MNTSSDYTHPSLEPYSRSGWLEVIYSWVIAMLVVGAILSTL